MEVVWSNNQISMLIELYQRRNFLWDPSNKDYKDKLKKNDAWADIAAELNMSQKEVETKMHILRSQFSREKKKIKTSKRRSGSEEVIKSKWQWYERLQFLLCGATTSGTSDTMGTDGSGSIEPSNSLLSVPLPPTTSLPAPTPPPSLQPPPPSPPLSQPNKRKYDNSLNEAYEIMRCAKKKEEPKDEFEIYGQYVASELRNVKNQRTVLQAKYYINNILLQARMGNFDNNFFGGCHGGSGWQGCGVGCRTTSPASTYTDASTPTHTPEHQTGVHTATGDELHFIKIEETSSFDVKESDN